MLAFLVFLAALSVLIFIHELGHFLVAKKAGVKVEEFGFGYPPRLWGKKVGETIYSINWLPFGGFVRLHGEDYLEDGRKGERALCNKSKLTRALVAFAGVAGNFLLGIVCFSVIYSFMGIPTKVDEVYIEAVAPRSPAQKAGLQPGEKIVSLQGQPVKTSKEFVEIIEKDEGEEVFLVTDRGEYRIVPRRDPPEGEGALGVAISNVDLVFYPFWQMPFRGAWVGIKEAVGWGMMILMSIVTAVESLVAGIVPEVAGPIGIYEITANVVKQGWFLTLQFIGVLSVNLAILNLLPLPALDGGRLLFIGIETIIGKRVKPKIEQYVHMVGMALLIALMILVTFNDFVRLFRNNDFLSKFLNSTMGIIKGY